MTKTGWWWWWCEDNSMTMGWQQSMIITDWWWRCDNEVMTTMGWQPWNHYNRMTTIEGPWWHADASVTTWQCSDNRVETAESWRWHANEGMITMAWRRWNDDDGVSVLELTSVRCKFDTCRWKMERGHNFHKMKFSGHLSNYNWFEAAPESGACNLHVSAESCKSRPNGWMNE